MKNLNAFFAIMVLLTFLALPVLTIWGIFSHGMLKFALSDLILLVFNSFMTNFTSEFTDNDDCE